MRTPLLVALAVGAALAAALVCLNRPAPAQSDQPRNLVLVSIDTLRADHLPFYGYHRNTAPGLAALAGRATVFEKTFACSSVTLPSHVTMMTGLHPRTHGVLNNSAKGSAQLLTLAEVVSAAGFSTAAFVGCSIVAATTGLDQGFQTYDDDVTSYFKRGLYEGTDVPPDWRVAGPFAAGVDVPAEDVINRALGWLRGQAKTPFFLFVHLYDPHNDYVPPRGYRRTFFTPDGNEVQRLRDLYDCEIFYADKQLRRLWRELERRHLRDNTLLVVSSDHGEGLGDHQYLLHALQVYDEELHVPLLMAGPGVPSKRVREVVDLADLFPTLLELLAVPAPANEGRSLVPLMKGDNLKLGRPFAYGQRFESAYPLRAYLLDGREYSAPKTVYFVRSQQAKLLLPSPGTPTLFDLVSDPSETRNVALQKPQLTQQYLRWAQQPLEKPLPAIAPAPRVLTPEEQQRLRALGYLAE